MPSPLQAIAGTDGRISINGTNLNLTKWVIDPQSANIKTTNFESSFNTDSTPQMCEESIQGILSTKIDFSGSWDLGQPPTTNPPNLRPGNQLANSNLYISKNNNKFFSFPLINVLEFKTSNDVEGKVNVDFSGVAVGAWLYPA